MANYSPRSVNTRSINDLNDFSSHQSSPHRQRAHHHDANANIICDSLDNTPSSTLSVHANQIGEEAHNHDSKHEKQQKNDDDK